MRTKDLQPQQTTAPIKPAIAETLQRIIQSNKYDSMHTSEPHVENPKYMITKVTVKPNPFSTTITLDISCNQSRHVIVRMFDEDGRIVKMLSWYLVKGTNVTSISELKNLNTGSYLIDVIDHEGKVLHSTEARKA
jgi:hypothetical protein